MLGNRTLAAKKPDVPKPLGRHVSSFPSYEYDGPSSTTTRVKPTVGRQKAMETLNRADHAIPLGLAYANRVGPGDSGSLEYSLLEMTTMSNRRPVKARSRLKKVGSEFVNSYIITSPRSETL